MIIGLTGSIASGKSSVAKILKEKGFEHYTYSDILRIEAEKRGIAPTRENLQKLGNKFKEESGNMGILSRMIIDETKGDKVVADGIRTVDEIEELKRYPDSYVIGVDAPLEVRYKRLKSRKREGDPIDFEKFKKIDKHENEGKTAGQNIGACLKRSDFIIDNKSSIEELRTKVESILKGING